MRTLTPYERDLIAGGTMTGSTNGTGGGDPPPSDPPVSGSGGDDYAYGAFFDDEMNALESHATEFSYYVSVEEAYRTINGGVPGSGGGGGGSRGGYDSSDYNGPEEGYIDYFATQHGPESIAVRAEMSASAFFNYAQNENQIRSALTNIVGQAPDAATANQQIVAYLSSIGLGSQLTAQVSDTGFAAVNQSLQQSPANNSDIVVNGYAFRVGTPNTVAGFGTQGQFLLASYMPYEPAPAQVYGSLEGVPASKKFPGLYLLPKNMTDTQKAAVVYNETRGIIDANQRQIVAAMVMQVIANNAGRSYLAAPPIASVSGSAQQAAWSAALNAVQNYGSIIASVYDMYNPMAQANVFIMRPDYSTAPWMGLTPLAIYGPFNAAGSPHHYIRFFKDPAYAP